MLTLDKEDIHIETWKLQIAGFLEKTTLIKIMKKNLQHTILIALTFFSFQINAQTSSYIVTSSNDTIYVDKFDIQSKKVKIKNVINFKSCLVLK